MRKLIVKSKSWCFDGLYFRGQLPNSIEWTSFDMMAAVFTDQVEAAKAMELVGICTWVTEVAPEPIPETSQLFKAAHTTRDLTQTRPTFHPSNSTGFKG